MADLLLPSIHFMASQAPWIAKIVEMDSIPNRLSTVLAIYAAALEFFHQHIIPLATMQVNVCTMFWHYNLVMESMLPDLSRKIVKDNQRYCITNLVVYVSPTRSLHVK